MDKHEMHKVLVNTRNTLASRGHTKGTPIDSMGRVCLYGALYRSGLKNSSLNIIEEFAMALEFDCSNTAVQWNNAPERTEEQVLARLDEAINRTAPEPEDVEIQIEEEQPTLVSV